MIKREMDFKGECWNPKKTTGNKKIGKSGRNVFDRTFRKIKVLASIEVCSKNATLANFPTVTCKPKRRHSKNERQK